MLPRLIRACPTAAACAAARSSLRSAALPLSSFRAMSAAAADPVKHWVLQYSYVDDAFEKRAPLRPAHLALTTEYKSAGKMLMGGAFAEKPMGALLTFYSTRADVESFVAKDPYVQSGADKKIVTDYAIREWTVVVGSSSNPNYAGCDPLKVGDRFPKGITLFEGNPGGAVDMDKMLAGKKVIVFGVPGAFTPGCSKTHLPGYVADAEKLKSKGIDEIVCVSVNDAFVMAAWGASAGAEGKVRMLADTTAELTKRLGLAIDLTAKLCSVRSKRYSMLVEDGIITQVNVEPESAPTGLTCSLSSAIKLPNKL